MIWLYATLALVVVLAVAVLVGTAISRLGDTDTDPYDHDDQVDDAEPEEEPVADDEAPESIADRARAKLRHPSAHRPSFVRRAPGSGREYGPRRPAFIPGQRRSRER